jgi:tryptophan 7-halogenase
MQDAGRPPIKKVTVLGGGTAGWMAAAALSHRAKGLDIAITLVESEAIGTIGVGEATVPQIRHFNAALGFDEAEYMRETKATFKLGIEFRNWGAIGDRYVHPFGVLGLPLDGVEFHQQWACAHAEGIDRHIDLLSLPSAMCRIDRFGSPASNPDDIRSSFSYAYQFDAGLYARYLRRYAEARGVRRIEGKVARVERDETTGNVAALELESGERVDGELFIDCSGFRGLLIEETLGAGYEDWSQWLPCDRAVALPCASAPGSLTPYTRATALDSGWVWRIPLQHRTGNGHVYCSSFTDADAAEEQLRAQLDGEVLAPPNHLRFVTGRRRKQWMNNVIAMGLAAGFTEPLESTSINMIQIAIGRLLDLFPRQGDNSVKRDEFNRLMQLEHERIRDFIILHYCATQRDDTPFWRYVRNMALPDSLQARIEAFRERGIIMAYRDGMFLPASWIAVMVGQNIIPQHFDPRCALVGMNDRRAWLEDVERRFSQAAESFPDHVQHLKSIGAYAA